MMLYQDASTHEWVPEQIWDLVVTMDDATSEHTSMLFCPEEGTDSSSPAATQIPPVINLFFRSVRG